MSKSRRLRTNRNASPSPVKESAETSAAGASGISKEMLELHQAFLHGLKKDEEARLTLIENKTSQLFSQTGIIIAILGLFLPLILDKVELPLLRVAFIALLLIAGLFYLLTIYHAGKNLNIRDFNYPRSTPETVRDPKLKTPDQFLAEEIKDLLYSIPIHVDLNNRKGSNLLKARNRFTIANIATGTLSAALCIAIALSFQKKDVTKVKIEGVVKTEATPADSATTVQEVPASPATSPAVANKPADGTN